MLGYLISGSLIIAGLIHIIPAAGVLGPEKLTSLYGIAFSEPNLAILMRHRAVLFGLLGAFLIVAAFKPAWQITAFIAGFASVVSFIGLAWSIGGYNQHVARVFIADLVAVTCLAAGAISYAILHGKTG
jgi:hypothetical protein